MARPRRSEYDSAEFAARYQSREQVDKLADALGVSDIAVRKAAERRGLKRPPSPIADIDDAMIERGARAMAQDQEALSSRTLEQYLQRVEDTWPRYKAEVRKILEAALHVNGGI